MALKQFKPNTAGQRGLVLTDNSDLHKGKPFKKLTKGLTKSGGRNNFGHLTSRRQGGGHKRKYRLIDFKRNLKDVFATVERIEYDPNRTANIALIKYENEIFSYIISPQKLKIGDKVISSDNKGLTVQPEGSDITLVIKKSQIALSSSDARPSRFVGGERIDAAISELNFEKRKVSLSIKLLEELQNKEAVSKFSSPLSGKNLPFSSLSDKLTNKKEKK